MLIEPPLNIHRAVVKSLCGRRGWGRLREVILKCRPPIGARARGIEVICHGLGHQPLHPGAVDCQNLIGTELVCASPFRSRAVAARIEASTEVSVDAAVWVPRLPAGWRFLD
eukprot:SAG31_NODE_3129_length_4646_cov_2.581262_5_plen_112_part_00